MSQPRLGRAPEGPWSDLATTLAQRRLLLGMTQREAADLSDLSEKALRDIESGQVAPRLGALTAIARTLGLDLALVPRGQGQTYVPGSLLIQPDTARS